MYTSKKVSVAIPTIGRTETLNAVITAVAFQSYPVDEIILLDEAKAPVTESYQVNQALDVLSVQGTQVKVLRDRVRKGIGAARVRLAEEARNDLVLMIDDDVVIRPDCLEGLVDAIDSHESDWAVPVCFLVPAALELDGYVDSVLSYDDERVQAWIKKYPWFIPYFRYEEDFTLDIECSGTQTILLRRDPFVKMCKDMDGLGNLPREDTYMTQKLGPGVFTSAVECLHYEHESQSDRGNWGRSMFYRIHQAVMKDPDLFLKMMKR